MPATKHMTLDSPTSGDELFAALLQVVQEGPNEIGGLSNEQHELLFTSGKTALSWGHLFAATVKQDGSGSVLQLTVAGVPGAPKALMDGRKNQKAGEKLIGSVEAVLASPTPPSPTSMASFALMADGSTVPWTSGEYPGA